MISLQKRLQVRFGTTYVDMKLNDHAIFTVTICQT